MWPSGSKLVSNSRPRLRGYKLTAMSLGYRDVYVAGSDYLEVHTERFSDGERSTVQCLGYLTPEEVRYAAVILGKPLENFEAPRRKKLASTTHVFETSATHKIHPRHDRHPL